MIDLRVMNNFSHNEQAAILENLARGVRQIDRALDAVAETKLLRQAHCRISYGKLFRRRPGPSPMISLR